MPIARQRDLFGREAGSVAQLHYRESCWPEGQTAPYQVKLSSGGLIYRNSLTRELGNVLATVPAAVADDPTLPRSQNASCMNCGHHEAVFFQSDTSDVRSDSLALIFVCCNCGHKWVT